MGFENLPKTTADLAQEQMAKLRALFPECVTESEQGLAVDFDLLRRALSPEAVVEGPNERYRLEWPGKRAARYAANAPTASTLRPVRERSKDFDATQNLYVEGDNLEALKLLRTAYAGKVKLIYIDPPYNTGHDFIYHDKYVRTVREEMAKAGLLDDEGRQTEDKDLFQKNDETNGRYHSDWLTMMYPRLLLARDLLTDDGVIFISIDYNENFSLRKICDEIFGADMFMGEIYWESKTKSQNTITAFDKLQPKMEMILVYARCQKRRFNLIVKGNKQYPLEDEKGVYREYPLEVMNASGIRGRESMIFPISDGVATVSPQAGKQWQLGQAQVATHLREGNLFIRDGEVIIKMRPHMERNEQTEPFWGFLDKTIGTAESAKKELTALIGPHGFETVKPLALLQRLVYHATNKGDDLVMDFFSGSATTAHAVMALNAEDGGNRKFILVQLPEKAELGSAAAEAGFANICEIGEERIRRAGEKILGEHPELRGKLDVGFRVLRVDEKNEAEVAQTPDDALTNWEAALQEETIKAGRTEEDLLFQALLRVTEPLLVERIEREVMAGLTVWSVADGFVVACLVGEGQLTAAKAEAVTRWIVGQAVSPSYVAFREAGFADDSVKLNVEAGLRQAGCKATLWVL